MIDSPRSGDRRHEERRGAAPARPRQTEESWFGALGVDGDTQLREDARGGDAESRYEGGWGKVGGTETDSRFISHQARRVVGAGQTAFQRIYSAFIAARAALGIALIATVVVAGVFGVRPPLAVILVSLGYAALSLATAVAWLFA